MARSQVSLFADPSGVRRAITEIANLQRQANDASDKQQARIFSNTRVRIAATKSAYLDLVKSVKRSFDDINSAAKKSADVAAISAKKSADARVGAEQSAAKQIASIHKKNLEEFEKAEKAKTRVALRYAQQRMEMDRRAGESSRRANAASGGGGGRTSASLSFSPVQAGRQFASDIHGQIQDARQRRAASGRRFAGSFFQAGADATESAALRARATSFARENGINSADLASAIGAAQTEFSVLNVTDQQRASGMSAQDARRENLNQALQNAMFARNTDQDMGEVMRVAGMLGQAGITGDSQRQTLLALTGMAQRGAIELGAVTRTALGPLQGRMATAVARLGPNASDQDRAAAQRRAIMQTFAEMEVAKSLGQSPRAVGNNLRNLEGALTDPNVQRRMLHNINASTMSQEQKNRARDALFERRSDGSYHMRANVANSPYELARAMQTGFSGNSELMSNVFGGGGHGNPQSLQRNWRTMLALFMGGGGAGTNNDRIQQLLSGMGTDFTEQDVLRGTSIFANDDQSQLNRDQETRDQALTDNTNEIVKLSNQFASFTANNPFTVTAMQALGGAFGGSFLSRISSFSFGMPGGGGVPGGMPGGVPAAGPGGLLMAGGSLTTMGIVGGVLASGYLAQEQIRTEVRRGTGMDAGEMLRRTTMNDQEAAAQARVDADQFAQLQRRPARGRVTDAQALLGPARDPNAPIADLSVPNVTTNNAAREIELGPNTMRQMLLVANRPTLSPHDAELVVANTMTSNNAGGSR